MPVIKKPKEELATKHVLVTKDQHRDIYKYAESIGSVTALMREMLHDYEAKISNGKKTNIETHLLSEPIFTGSFSISKAPNPNKISIFHESGEGGQFNMDQFNNVVADFYHKNF